MVHGDLRLCVLCIAGAHGHLINITTSDDQTNGALLVVINS